MTSLLQSPKSLGGESYSPPSSPSITTNDAKSSDTCLRFDTEKIRKVQDNNMEKLLKSLSIDDLERLLNYFFASHPQLINQSFSDSNENEIEKVIPGFKEQIKRESDLADKKGCSKKRISLFAPEHIYCESVYGIKKRFSLPMSMDQQIFSPDDENN